MADVSEEAIDAALAADQERSRQAREIVFLSPGRDQVRVMLEAAAPLIAGDLVAELGEAQSEAAMIRDHASRYLQAVYGQGYVYRAPETFGNLVERWIWAVASGVPEMAHASIAAIERHCAERDAEADSSDEEVSDG